MQTLTIFQVDAFSDQLFKGNPAAVIPLEAWLPDGILQQIAVENNLSETAFFMLKDGNYQLRWFTPLREVDLCGHATLATAHVLYQHLNYKGSDLTFDTRSGKLSVKRSANRYLMNFPTDTLQKVKAPEALLGSLPNLPSEVYRGKDDYMLVFDSEKEIKRLKPNFQLMKEVASRGVIVTAPGEKCDFVSRFFAPQCGIDEDPVTGSAHTTLVPYWAKRLKKNELKALQLSARGGELYCKYLEKRTEIAGAAITFLKGEIWL